jgi:hypothetical protein
METSWPKCGWLHPWPLAINLTFTPSPSWRLGVGDESSNLSFLLFCDRVSNAAQASLELFSSPASASWVWAYRCAPPRVTEVPTNHALALALSRGSATSHFKILFVVLGLELRAFTLSHSTSPFLWWVFSR